MDYILQKRGFSLKNERVTWCCSAVLYPQTSQNPFYKASIPATHPHPSEEITLPHLCGHSTSNLSPPPLPSLTIGPPPLSLCADTIFSHQFSAAKYPFMLKAALMGPIYESASRIYLFLAINFSVLLIFLMKP